jgi:hypothetical protein
MATDWRMKGQYLKNCSCDPGCPCDFWAPPTRGNCHGCNGMKITEGHFGNIPLDGVIWAAAYSWPGALHEGNGTIQPFIDPSASEPQRNAVLSILSGQQGGPWFQVLASVVKNFLSPKYLPIEFEFDIETRRARMKVANEFEVIVEPIRDINGNEHRALIELPNGIEYFSTEIAVAKILKSTGDIPFDEKACHSSLSEIEQSPAGLVK